MTCIHGFYHCDDATCRFLAFGRALRRVNARIVWQTRDVIRPSATLISGGDTWTLAYAEDRA